MQTDMEKDITKNRHRGSVNSIAAFAAIQEKLPRERARVLEEIDSSGLIGITCKELAEKWGVGMNVISGRFSELKKKRLITKIDRREGSGVFICSKRLSQLGVFAERR